MGITQQLFNTSPKPSAKPIKDKRGRRYWVVWYDDKEATYVYLWYFGRVIGLVKLLLIYPELHLADIIISKTDHRKNGLGSALLQEVKTYAKWRGVHVISGWIAEHDAEENPDLIDWYRRNGFQVTVRRDNISVATIRLELKTDDQSGRAYSKE